VAIFFFSCNVENKYILKEDFNYNKHGWIEESTEFHQVKIESGYYYLSSIDTSGSTYSSTGSLDKSYLIGLPNVYELNTKIKLIDNKHDDVNYGVFLYGASVKYSFIIHNTGKIEVLEYDYNSEKERVLLAANSELAIEDDVTCSILINNYLFKLFIDDYEIGVSEFRVKGWQELRLFTSRESTIAIDYINIRELNVNQ
jgi:hypothetical protein